MLYREYEDFNQCFINLNKELLLNPELMEYYTPRRGFINNLFIKIKNNRCDKIDIGALGYGINKWNHLLDSYLGNDKIEELKHLGENTRKTSCCFDFLRRDKSCIREIIISKKDYGKPWDSIRVVWRVSELQRKFAVDLILISKIISLIPNSKFEDINLFLPTGYQSNIYIIPFVNNIFKVNFEDLNDNNKHTHAIIKNYRERFKTRNPERRLLRTGERLIDLYERYENKESIKSITEKDLILEVKNEQME